MPSTKYFHSVRNTLNTCHGTAMVTPERFLLRDQRGRGARVPDHDRQRLVFLGHSEAHDGQGHHHRQRQRAAFFRGFSLSILFKRTARPFDTRLVSRLVYLRFSHQVFNETRFVKVFFIEKPIIGNMPIISDMSFTQLL